MGWLGKAIGGLAGWALGGPLGAILGAAAGHLYDSATSKPSFRFRCPRCNRELTASGMGVHICPHCSTEFELLNCPHCGSGLVAPLGTPSAVLICPYCGGDVVLADAASRMAYRRMVGALAFFALAGKLAKIDGRVSEQEIEVVSRFMDDIGMDRESKEVAKQIFREAKRSPHDYREIALQFKDEFRGEPQMARVLIDFLIAIAYADGVYSEAERGMIEELVALFGLTRSEYESLLAAYDPKAELGRYYEILGVPPDATDEQIKARHRELVKSFHPDALSSKGLAPELLEFANQRLQEINLAYQKIMEARGR
ncbi:MAG TPA: hypothetical protein ENF73_06495 [Proteobacteria bacterium]|nr:hypothetical protein [Pseudomonadota bacterium]